jgi:hypothetical protein
LVVTVIADQLRGQCELTLLGVALRNSDAISDMVAGEQQAEGAAGRPVELARCRRSASGAQVPRWVTSSMSGRAGTPERTAGHGASSTIWNPRAAR